MRLRRLEINGGRVSETPHWSLILPPTAAGYADAQIDDYGFGENNRRFRRDFPHFPGTELSLKARFSHPANALKGTAGFGFWNAPFGDPTVRWPAIPQATWFFFASEPNDLPFAESGPGRGWFAATLDARNKSAAALIPFSPFILLMNQVMAVRRKIWPAIRRRLQISFQPIQITMNEWHTYTLLWQTDGCSFLIDSKPIQQTEHTPSGPLGFVCWIDNQYLVAKPNGRLRWGTLATKEEEWLAVENLCIKRID